MHDTSTKLLTRAASIIPAGVNSPVRAWGAVGGEPRFLVRGRGAFVWDADGNEFIDLVCAWGPLIAGHAHPDVVQAVTNAAKRGTGFGAPNPVEIELAEAIVGSFPSIEKVRLVTSGTEATMTAMRIARGATGRSRVIKFNGCYHGHHDSLLVKAGSGAATLGVPDSAGVPAAISELTSVVEYNDLESLRASIAADPPPAAVIVEPVAANMGVVPPSPGFLESIIELSHEVGALVIFDEVISGFRVARGGAQELYDVRADLTCLGKVIGGGLPAAAVGGRADLLDLLAPIGPVYQAGTLSGNPIACTAGRETVRLLDDGAYATLERRGAALETGLKDAIGTAGVQACVQRVGSLLTLFFGVESVCDFKDASSTDTEAFASFFRAMIENGVNLPPSQYEAWFVSLAHGDAEIDRILDAAKRALGA
ncbi:MAG: glutamate-1-semialdehyde 2,1-aminomutase [Candidatus Binatia bacterium]|nr:glutamate-1-semialdehyde 2,1-aminomutase [Candidatus Binatia bacterium]